MQALPKSRVLQFVEQAFHLARRAVAQYSSKFSKRRYTLHQHIVLLCLKVRKNTTYRTLLDELIEMPRIRRAGFVAGRRMRVESSRGVSNQLTTRTSISGKVVLKAISPTKRLLPSSKNSSSGYSLNSSW
ncbi:ISH9-type transposase [Natrialba aegyptia DSM 13077]|uniref:ISH9-type transposase n=1 Tax=Natrialba aegyptia DSM 13077 TaxID=1227491 RepID=M0AM55_9EURY|nr:ISH9-type transposase [Natrialba aegyptia DSM 13077]